ncbi:sensor histidine kinase [Rugamonas sp.]|uniref:sensor histidine kinase n=1 Tax=Rugamonas sp. TaxID=1926287 RepID=UPI00345B9CE4
MSISSLLQSKPAPGVRASLAALVIACVLPVTGVAAFLIVRVYDHQRGALLTQTGPGLALAQLTAGLHATLFSLAAATLAALVAGLALAWLIGGRIAQSVRALIAPALALGGGHHMAPLPPLPPLHFKEARALGLALRHAADGMRRVQAGMRESEQRLALVADAAHLGVWVRDLARRTIWMSDQWRALFGFAPEQTVQLVDLLLRVHPDDRVAVQRTLDQCLHGVSRYDMEYRIVLPDGELRWIGSHGSVALDAAGRPALVHGVSLDITPRKRAELDLQQKQKEVTHLSRVAVLGELSGALAHELNQPLTAILSNAQAALRFMERQPVDLDEVREILRDIVGEDQRAGQIIRRLRRLFDKKEMPHQHVDLDALVRDTVRLLRNDLINHGITVLTELGGDATVHADRVQLQQVLINLLMNGCDAMAGRRPGGTIVVRTRRLSAAEAVAASVAGPGTAAATAAAPCTAATATATAATATAAAAAIPAAPALTPADSVELIVADNGAGIAPADLERIFEPFYTTKERGMGLGLSICRSIVGAHGGRLWAGHNSDAGARFYLRLPLADGGAP